MQSEHLKLENQLCFPFYAASRLIIRGYKPLLDQLGITYPQYLVLLVLWETDAVAVSTITEKLLLDTNTITPLLKRMEEQGLVTRQRSAQDGRRVIVTLTEQGKALKADAAAIPEALTALLCSFDISTEEMNAMVRQINGVIAQLTHQPDHPEPDEY